MEYSTLVEIVAATHLSKFVQSPFDSRGGLMLVAPPGAFKTTITETMDEFPSTHIVSDINVQSLIKMKDAFLSNQITTLGFSDFAKLYKRHASVASNVEGIIMGLADEGFRKPSWHAGNPGGSIPARCTIIAGMTTAFFEEHVSQWEKDGFLRRFIFAKYIIEGMEVVEDAVSQWRKAQFDGSFIPKIPSARTIQYGLDKADVELVNYSVRHQPSRSSASVMMQKIFCILQWKFKEEKARFILQDFAPCLSKDGGILVLKETNAISAKVKAARQ